MAGAEVVAMQGRFHLYEGYDVVQASLPIHVMHRLGVKLLLISNAAGGLDPRMKIGEPMLIDSHIDFTNRQPLLAGDWGMNQRPGRRSDIYDLPLIAEALRCARQGDFVAHRGSYAAMLGPNYETRAEYQFLRRIGIQAVGMSTVPEVTAASHYAMRVLAVSIITNVANSNLPTSTTAVDVIGAAESALPQLRALFVNAIKCLG
jgi:purine-nucleoside phosphorylase